MSLLVLCYPEGKAQEVYEIEAGRYLRMSNGSHGEQIDKMITVPRTESIVD